MGILMSYAAWTAGLVMPQDALSCLRIQTWALIGCTGVLAMLAGAARNSPAKRLHWPGGGA